MSVACPLSPPKAAVNADIFVRPVCATSGCEQSQQTNSLFDHLVGEGDQLIPHMEAKHFGDLAVDHELEVYLASG
jgi:hypothetical protein